MCGGGGAKTLVDNMIERRWIQGFGPIQRVEESWTGEKVSKRKGICLNVG